MALTRKMLKAMGIDEEKIEQIIDAHSETVEGLKSALASAEETGKDIPALQRKLKQAEEELETAKKDGWKDKHDKVKKDFDDYKADITAKEQKAAKEKAVRAYFENKNIVGKSLDIAMKGSAEEIAGIELDGENKIKDTAALDALVSGTFAGLVSTTVTKGANTATPPANGAAGTYSSKAEIMKIKDPVERQTAIAKNINLFQ